MPEIVTRFLLPSYMRVDVDNVRVKTPDRFITKSGIGTVSLRVINLNDNKAIWEGIVPVGQDITVQELHNPDGRTIQLFSAGIKTPQTDEISSTSTLASQSSQCKMWSLGNPFVIAVLIALMAALIYYVYQRFAFTANIFD